MPGNDRLDGLVAVHPLARRHHLAAAVQAFSQIFHGAGHCRLCLQARERGSRELLRAGIVRGRFAIGDKPFAGRALTAQFMPSRPDMVRAVAAEGKAEGRVSGTNSWVINELQMGDTMVADGYGKIIEGTLIGSNLGSGIAAHTHSGFIFDAGIRDAEENREIANLNGFYRGYDPSAWAQMNLTGIDIPVRIGRAIVLPGDLVLAKHDGVIFIPAVLAAQAIAKAEFTNLQDAFNFDLNKQGANGAEFEGGWTAQKFDALEKWVNAHPEKLKMTKAEFSELLTQAKAPRPAGGRGRGGQ